MPKVHSHPKVVNFNLHCKIISSLHLQNCSESAFETNSIENVRVDSVRNFDGQNCHELPLVGIAFAARGFKASQVVPAFV